MQGGDVICGHCPWPEVVVHPALVLGDHFALRSREEGLIELAHQVLLDEVLEAERHHARDPGAGRAGGEVRIDQGRVLRVLEHVADLVTV